MFRSSSAGYSLGPGYRDPPLQQATALGDQSHEPSHVTSEHHVSHSQDTVLSVQYTQQELLGRQRIPEKSVSRSAGSFHMQEGGSETSSHSYHAVQHSHASSVGNTDGKTPFSSSASWLQQPQSPGSSPDAAGSTYNDAGIAGLSEFGQRKHREAPHQVSSDGNTTVFSKFGQGLDLESPRQLCSDLNGSSSSMFGQGLSNESPDDSRLLPGMQGHEEGADSDLHYNWSVQSQSHAGSAGSPGRDSLHSWTDSTPVRAPAPQDPASPDARTILRSIARECQHAVEGKSPVVPIKASRLSPQSRPDLSRTPNSFFNPSFDADEMSKSS